MLYAFIPARAGSKRIPNKNFKKLADIPLVEYTIKAAKEANVFDQIYISTDDKAGRKVAGNHNINFIERPLSLSDDFSPDLGWITHLLAKIDNLDTAGYFMILRPTNPFRTSKTILRAINEFNVANKAQSVKYTSLKSIQKVTEYPAKMWCIILEGDLLSCCYSKPGPRIPIYEQQSSCFDNLYIQNGCIDICSIENLTHSLSYLGIKIKAFFTEGYEGFDINTLPDWDYAEYLIAKGVR